MSVIDKLGRYLRAWIYLPYTVKDNAAVLKEIRDRPRDDAEDAPRPPEETSPPSVELERYCGYTKADLEVFSEFSHVQAQPAPGFVTDYIGSRTRITSLWDSVQNLDNTVMGIPVPYDYHADAIEWIGTLRAVLAAKDQFVAMELGAGFGPWLVAGGSAARLRGISDIRLTGIEADPGRFALMRTHLQDNGFNPDHHILLEAAVGVEEGIARWPRLVEPRNDAGGRPIFDPGAGEGDFTEVRVLSFASLLERETVWDLIHIDIQGDEFAICRANLERIQQRARYLVIGTHSRKLDGDLVDLFCRGGFILENEKPARFTFWPNHSSLEAMTTHDGAQVWRNPRL